MSTSIPILKEYILKECLAGEDPANLKNDTELMGSGILDSLSTLQLIEFLEKTFAVSIDASEIDSDNLGSLQKISDFVEKKKKG